MNSHNKLIKGLTFFLIAFFITFPDYSLASLEIIEGLINSHFVHLPIIYFNFPLPPPSPGYILITEILYDPEDGNVEWIEIYNSTTQTFDLKGYKIGDEETRNGFEGMLRFPDGSSIDSGQVKIIAQDAFAFENRYGLLPDFEMVNSGSLVPDMRKYSIWSNGRINLANTGDEVLLLNSNDAIVDVVSWGNSIFAFSPSINRVSKGVSLERYPAYQDENLASDWRPNPSPAPGEIDVFVPTPTYTSSPSPTVTPSPSMTITPIDARTATPTLTITPVISGTVSSTPQCENSIIVSEVMFNPIYSEPGYEWIEIFNPGPCAVDLTNIKIGDEETLGEGEGMLLFPDGASVDSGEYQIVAYDGELFQNAYGFLPDYEMDDKTSAMDMNKYSYWSNGVIRLNNDGDEVLILGVDNWILDAVSWGASNWAFDPPVNKGEDGESISRIPDDIDTDTAMDWVNSNNPSPGTSNIP